MFGYESWVEIGGVTVLATSADTSLDRSIIESSGVYGGTVNGQGKPLGQVHYYDWPIINANFSADVNTKLIPVLQLLLLNRDVPISFTLKSGTDGMQKVQNAWWNNISIQASEDSPVTATVGFVAMERENFDTNSFGDYWKNESGNLGSDCGLFSGTSPLNLDTNNSPVPFWNTTVSGFEKVKNWTFSANQDVVRFMGCMNNGSNFAKNPYALGVGTMTSGFKVSTFDEVNTDIWNMPDKYAGQDLNVRKTFALAIANLPFLTLECELNQAADPLQGANSMDGLDFDYQVYNYY